MCGLRRSGPGGASGLRTGAVSYRSPACLWWGRSAVGGLLADGEERVMNWVRE
jgi:hypothetical protein